MVHPPAKRRVAPAHTPCLSGPALPARPTLLRCPTRAWRHGCPQRARPRPAPPAWPPARSATTYSVIRSFVASAHAMGRTTVISLLQPAPEVGRGCARPPAGKAPGGVGSMCQFLSRCADRPAPRNAPTALLLGSDRDGCLTSEPPCPGPPPLCRWCTCLMRCFCLPTGMSCTSERGEGRPARPAASPSTHTPAATCSGVCPRSACWPCPCAAQGTHAWWPAPPLAPPACSGPVAEILPFFERQLDFVCPVRKDIGSFLQASPPALACCARAWRLRGWSPSRVTGLHAPTQRARSCLRACHAHPQHASDGAACLPGVAQEVTTPVGQYAYASPALLARKGLTEADQDPLKVGGWAARVACQRGLLVLRMPLSHRCGHPATEPAAPALWPCSCATLAVSLLRPHHGQPLLH